MVEEIIACFKVLPRYCPLHDVLFEETVEVKYVITPIYLLLARPIYHVGKYSIHNGN